MLIAACTYAINGNDRDFAIKNWEALQSGRRWLEQHVRQGELLLHQRAYADWADSVARKGAVLYTNVVYWKALIEMTNLAKYLDHQDEITYDYKAADKPRREIIANFWRDDLGYFVTSKTLENLSSAGNLLAIAWGLVDEEQANSILDAIERAMMAEPVPTQVAYPTYAKTDIALENRLAGIGNYHTNGAWLWIGAWHCIALARAGHLNQSQTLLSRIAEIIVKDGQVYEVYGPNGKPISNIIYTSEAPLTWSAGMFIYAFHEIESYQTVIPSKNSKG